MQGTLGAYSGILTAKKLLVYYLSEGCKALLELTVAY